MESNGLKAFLFFSLALHLGFLAIFPLLKPKAAQQPPVFEVTWIKPATRPILPKHSPSKTSTRTRPISAKPAPKPAHSPPKPSFAIQAAPIGLLGGQLALGESQAYERPQAKLALGLSPEPAKQTGQVPKVTAGAPKGLSSDQVVSAPKGPNPSSQPWQSKLQTQQSPTTLNRQAKQAAGTPNQWIAGEIQGRPVIFTPPLPSLDIEKDIEVALEFVVNAEGAVVQIIPVKKSNPQLEALAIKLLGEYRFKPLPGSPNQRGVIRFVLRRSGR